jgi:hypothetical protein
VLSVIAADDERDAVRIANTPSTAETPVFTKPSVARRRRVGPHRRAQRARTDFDGIRAPAVGHRPRRRRRIAAVPRTKVRDPGRQPRASDPTPTALDHAAHGRTRRPGRGHRSSTPRGGCRGRRPRVVSTSRVGRELGRAGRPRPAASRAVTDGPDGHWPSP